MMPLRVAYLPPSLRPAGAERQMLALAERLPRDRFQVEFLAMSGPGEYDGRAQAAGAKVRIIGKPTRSDASRPERIAARGRRALRYAMVARAQRYDIVDAWLYPVDLMAAFARPFTHTPVILTGRRNLRDFYRPMGRFERGINRLADRFVDAVVVNSEAVAADTLRNEGIDPRKVRVIRNGVELIDPIRPEERAWRRRALGVSDDEILIGSIANYHAVKRLDLLVDAYASLSREGLPVRLLLVGEGPVRGLLETRIAQLGLRGRVQLYGATPDPRSLYGSVDLIVQASRSEGLPNALLEAAAAGLPIAATAAGGSGEIVLNGETGLLVPVENGEALTTAMRQLVIDAALRDRLGVAARRHVEARFGMARFVSEVATLYEELAAAKNVTA